MNKVGIVVFHIGAFGGASKRFCNLFYYLDCHYNGQFVFVVNQELFDYIKKIFPFFSFKNVVVVDCNGKKHRERIVLLSQLIDSKKNGSFSSKLEFEDDCNLLRKSYWYLKNIRRQYRLYKEIERVRTEKGIDIFLGVYSGILPLYFYFWKRRRPAVVFCDMDSWFYEIHPEQRKYWYRKYFSFNYALKMADRIDFLSPFIYNGVKQIGVPLDERKVAITPCSFIDYSKCSVGDKAQFAIAFAGRLEPNKNPILFIEAAKLILLKYPDVCFYLLGDGALKDQIAAILAREGLANRIVFEFHANPPEIFAKTSVFVSLQSTNNYPSQSVLEAMACGNAIVATDVGDTRMFINEHNGLLIEPALNSLVSALEYLINNRDLTREMGAYARNYAMDTHSIEKHSQYYIDLLNSAYNDLHKI